MSAGRYRHRARLFMGEDGKHCSRVIGLSSGPIATLPGIGWNPFSPFLRADPSGFRGQEDGYDLSGLVKEIFWKRAGPPCQGPGVENGVPLSSACKVEIDTYMDGFRKQLAAGLDLLHNSQGNVVFCTDHAIVVKLIAKSPRSTLSFESSDC
eukprot:13392578-Heterocapsa_arctica.AAC.1